MKKTKERIVPSSSGREPAAARAVEATARSPERAVEACASVRGKRCGSSKEKPGKQSV